MKVFLPHMLMPELPACTLAVLWTKREDEIEGKVVCYV